MKLIAQAKLKATQEQSAALRETLERGNAACDHLSEVAFAKYGGRAFSQYALQKIAYHSTRERFGIGAQLTIRCLAKVADAYKAQTSNLARKNHKRAKRGRDPIPPTQVSFKSTSAIAFDDRNLSWHLSKGTVSITTTRGRLIIPFVCGDRQRELLATRRGETDLIHRDGEFYLFAVCDVDEPEPPDFDEALGVDLGIVNIATDSDGEVYSTPGAHINSVRGSYRRLRKKLQSNGSRSARRLLRKRSGREARHARDINHQISKRIVEKAQGTDRAIAIEDLNGIRFRVKARRRQRATLHSWSFGQLRAFIEYKARRAGVALVAVDPAYTSQTCPECGRVSRGNRRSQSHFCCVSCGLSGHADTIAARNIAGRAVVMRPHAPAGAICA